MPNRTIVFPMKFVLAILAYAISGAVLACGILMTVQGKPAALIVGMLVYLAALAGFGCLPKQSH
jgi:hypothetical protein